ncbi:MAG: hypothetical protein IJ952_07415, partial [Alistipes sp.]|nr:hypothetical protein [Alistipes sp.]
MKRVYILVALVVATISVSAQDLVVASYNIRNDNSGDTKRGNGWAQRCPIICDQIEWNDIDILGAQEVKRNQIDDMLKELEGYAFVGVGRDDGKDKGEFSPVFYKTERFKLLDQGTFWISETPEKVGIKGWDAALPRICSYAHLQDKLNLISAMPVRKLCRISGIGPGKAVTIAAAFELGRRCFGESI